MDECLSKKARQGAVPAGITVDTQARWYCRTAVSTEAMKLDRKRTQKYPSSGFHFWLFDLLYCARCVLTAPVNHMESRDGKGVRALWTKIVSNTHTYKLVSLVFPSLRQSINWIMNFSHICGRWADWVIMFNHTGSWKRRQKYEIKFLFLWPTKYQANLTENFTLNYRLPWVLVQQEDCVCAPGIQ